MVTFDLPQEILIEIFSWLPAKSVGKCRCLAKQWRNLLSTPQFIESHLTRRRDQENIIITTTSHSTHSIKDDAVPRELEFPNKFSWVVGSCNGLVFLTDDKFDQFLVNPTTLQQVKIPNSPLPIEKGEKGDFVGRYEFGYDRFSDDYKVVRLCIYEPVSDSEYEPDCDDTFVYLYSVKRGIWKRVHKTPNDHAIPNLSPGAFVNGAIHWMSRGFPSVIIAFNLVNEVFEEIPVPADSQHLEFNGLVALGGCLCYFEPLYFGQMDFWVMKEYGVPESWNKFSIVLDFEGAFVKPVCFIGDENVVLLTREHRLVVCNLKDRTLRDMFVGAVNGTTFIESLVSPGLL